MQVGAPAFPSKCLDQLNVGGEGGEGVALPLLPFVVGLFNGADVLFAGIF